MSLVPVERLRAGGALAHDEAGDVRPRLGQLGTIHHQDGAIEPVTGEDGLQMLGRMIRRKANVGIDAQED